MVLRCCCMTCEATAAWRSVRPTCDFRVLGAMRRKLRRDIAWPCLCSAEADAARAMSVQICNAARVLLTSLRSGCAQDEEELLRDGADAWLKMAQNAVLAVELRCWSPLLRWMRVRRDVMLRGVRNAHLHEAAPMLHDVALRLCRCCAEDALLLFRSWR